MHRQLQSGVSGATAAAFDPSSAGAGGDLGLGALRGGAATSASVGSEFSIFTAKPVGLEWLGGDENVGGAPQAQRRFAAVSAGSGCVLAALQNGDLSRWYPIEQEHSAIDFGRERCNDISGVFLEPKGFHALITGSSGDCWYLNFQSNSARALPKLRGHIVDAVAWDPDSTPESTKDLVLGTAGGQLLHLVVEGKERTLRPLFIFEIGGGGGAFQPISGVHRERTVAAADGAARDVVFAAAGCGIYAFVGPSLDTMFQKYQGEGASLRALVYEVPRDSPHGTLHVEQACVGPPSAKALFWLTGVGVLAATMLCPIQGDREVLESPPGLIPFPRPPKARAPSGSLISTLLPQPPQAPLSMALTKYHIVFLFEDRWAAVSRITHEVVQQQEWPKATYGSLRCFARDVHGEQLWMCSDKYLFEIVADREDRDVWSLLLRLERFDEALVACTKEHQRNRILSEHADCLYRRGLYVESARKFAEAATVPFEHVALRFAGPEKKAALLEYIRCRLDACAADDKVTRSLLSVMAIETSLAYLNDLYFKAGYANPAAAVAALSGEGQRSGRRTEWQEELLLLQQERSKLQQLLQDCADLEVHPTIYHLLQSHGWLEELAFFAEARHDYTTVIVHHVSRRDFAAAIRKLGDFEAASECEDLVSRFAPVLFGAEPKSFVSLLLRPSMASIAPLSVLPGICGTPCTSAEMRREAVRYVEHALKTQPELAGASPGEGEGAGSRRSLLLGGGDVMRGLGEDGAGGAATSENGPWSSGTAILSALVVLYARDCKKCGEGVGNGKTAGEIVPGDGDHGLMGPMSAEDNLMRFITSQEGNKLFDLHFALRVCSEYGLARATVQLYGYMGQHEEAVEVALKHNDLSLAKHNACKPADKRLRQKLWLRIVEHQSSGGDAQAIVQNIAALIHESQELSVCDVLPYMSDMITIDSFQAEICECLDSYKDQVLTLRQEMDDHRRALQAFKEDLKQAQERSVVVQEDQPCEICGEHAMNERFYAFACGHCFHEACLRALVVPALDEANRQKLFALEAKRIEHQAAHAGAGGGAAATGEMEQIEDGLDDILAEDCPLCGKLMIQAITRPFVDPHEAAEVESWAIC
eukprot:TRINITY_DN37833_c0_g1_i1.p1 TRINITY_DN37833_c0_g1~~TRINITY_DN37833_c0_g1_i1.p1  ORF type:complete len:1102 (-),score=277.50 TRINITY_DN37833_c0_g1_i1:4-3309(-)